MREEIIVFRADRSACEQTFTSQMQKILEEDNGELLQQALAQNCVGMVSALNLVCNMGKIQCLQVLLNSNADPNEAHRGKTPLMWACTGMTDGHVQCVTALISRLGESINQVLPSNENSGRSAVTICCINNNTKCLRLLIDADVDLTEPKSATPLYLCCAYEFDEGVELLLLKNKALVNQKNADDTTPLMAACENGNAGIVQRLVEAKASTEQVSRDHMTALRIACQHGYEPCARVLIDGGADKNAANKFGITALFIACTGGHLACVQLLIKSKANVNRRTNMGDTPIMPAASRGHRDVVNALIKAKANLNFVNDFDHTALTLATENCHALVVRELINEKTLSEQDKMSALKQAVDAKTMSIARMLFHALEQRPPWHAIEKLDELGLFKIASKEEALRQKTITDAELADHDMIVQHPERAGTSSTPEPLDNNFEWLKFVSHPPDSLTAELDDELPPN